MPSRPLALHRCRPPPWGERAGNAAGTSRCSHSALVVRILADALERFRPIREELAGVPEVLQHLRMFEAHACGVVFVGTDKNVSLMHQATAITERQHAGLPVTQEQQKIVKKWEETVESHRRPRPISKRR
jgi:hypothetical protein